ncbi:MAG: DNA translocase FtsK 4TM domain-containing protein, partial [Jhaorihella sp.]
MAYQTRGRDPLLDSTTQAAIEKRGKELIGVLLIVLGLAAAAMIGSYSPDDPNWLVSTDAPVQNWLGHFGASVAAPLFMIAGWACWGLPLVLLVWGLRFVLHLGDERAAARLIFAPIAIAVSSVYAATLVPGPEWSATHSFDLGGLFGETVLGALLTLLPVGSHFAVRVVSILAAGAMLGLGAFVLGFTRAEMGRLLKLSLIGVVMAYGALVSLLGRGAVSAMRAARAGRARRAERIAARQEAAAEAAIAPKVVRVDAGEPPLTQAPQAEAGDVPAERAGFLSRMPALMRRPDPMPEPELVEPQPLGDDGLPADDARIRAKIADVIRSRAKDETPPPPVSDRPLTRGLGRGPDPLVLNPAGPGNLRPEPPLTRADAPPPPVAQPVPLPLNEPEPQAVQVPPAEPRKVVQNPARKAPAPSRRARAEAQPALAFEDDTQAFELPPLSLLTNPAVIQRHHLSDEALEENARMLESVLDDYGVKGEIVSVRPGPVVTMYELEPAPGLKASRVIGLADDIARSMSALSARVSTVPGRSVIGIELPNENREKVVLREILASRDFGDSNMSLPLALGKNIGGDSIVANLAKMPHLLIAGTTGSGKSVAINTMILSLLYKLTPEECRLIMIDPKMLELSVYDGIPHLLSPVVTDPKKAVVALKWVVGEMEER